MKTSRRAGIAACFSISAITFGSSYDGVPFSRAHRAGEKSVYSVEMGMKELESTPTKVDLTVTTLKVLASGGAQLQFHWSNLQRSADDHTQLCNDVTLNTTANNMPGKFQPTMQTIDFTAALLLMANATADKAVAVGEETPFSWTGSEMGFKGKVKLISIDKAKNQIHVSSKATLVIQSKDVAQLDFTSVDDLTTGQLLSSIGSMAGALSFKFTLKK